MTNPYFQKKHFEWSCIYTLLLKAHYGNVHNEILHKLIGYNHHEITRRRRELGIPNKGIHELDPKAKEFIYANKEIYSNEQMIEKLNELFPRKQGYKSGSISTFLSRSGNKRSKETRAKFASEITKEKWSNNEIPPWEGYKAWKVVCRKKNGKPLYKIKTPDGWRIYKIYLYELHHGKVPKNMNVVFKDGNLHNFSPDNLILEPRTKKTHEMQSSLHDEYVASLLTRSETGPEKAEKVKALLEYPALIEMKKLSIKILRDVRNKSKLEKGDQADEEPLL